MDKLSEEELARMLVEFCLTMLTYDGDIQGYKIQTTEVLSGLHIGIQVEKDNSSKKETAETPVTEAV